jgi:hypothetical protein
MTVRSINILGVIAANLFNLLTTGIMLSRPLGRKRLERYLGLATIALILPLSFVVVSHATNSADFWMIMLPGLMILFLILEWVLDYVLKLDFRQTRLLGPYLLFFYAAQWGMIGFGFLVDRVSGFITLLTYFLSLGATAYSYVKVGHGERAVNSADK